MTKRGIPMEDRFWAKVDKTDECWLWKGCKHNIGYGTFNTGERKEYAHRLAWMLTIGPIHADKHIDHRCHNKLCVNPGHLREVSRKQNMENRSGAHKNSATGVRGVFWNKAKMKYRAAVAHNKHVYHVGYFDNIQDAEDAVIAKRNELFTHSDMDR